HVISNACVFIDNGVFYSAIGADADARFARLFMFLNRVLRFVIIAAQQYSPVQNRSGTHQATKPYDAMRNCRAVDNAAVRNDRVIDLRTVNFRTRQEAWS